MNRRELFRRSAASVVGLALPRALFLSHSTAATTAEPFDLLITGGTIVDGTGEKRFEADLGIRNGRIATIGRLAGSKAKQTLTAAGRVVAPGFIDIHTHSDRTLLNDPRAESGLRQGATTHVVGNCGASPSPLAQPGEIAGRTLHSYADFLAALRDAGVSINVCGLVGHNTIREAVMGMQNRQPTETEMRKMRDHVDEAMRAGAVGISTGLVSPPGSWSKTSEIVELARVAGRRGGMYASHMRGEASTLIDSVKEALTVGREGRLPVEISHHKAAGRENWGKTRQTLPMVEAAVKEGVVARVDVYPYRAGSAGLSQLVPPWAHEGGTGAMLERLRNADTRAQIAREMEDGAPDWPNFFHIDWDDIQITTATTADNRQWVGKKVGDVARARGCSGVEACINLLVEERSSIGMINFIMDEDEVRRVMAHPLAMIGSDGFAIAAEIAQAKGFHTVLVADNASDGAILEEIARYLSSDSVIL